MAEFGERATTLAGPQGAGSEVIAPVREQAIDTGIAGLPIINGLVDIFNKGLVNNAKAEAEKAKNAVVSAYVNEETAINNAVATGQMKPEVAAARGRANFSKHAASYPAYIEDLQKAGNALKGLSEKGDVEDAVASAKKIRDADIAQAQQNGYTFPKGMSEEEVSSTIRASKAMMNAEREQRDFYARQTEKRAQGNYDQGEAAREQKEMGIRHINMVVGDNQQAFQALGNTLARQVRAGQIDPLQAQAQLSERFGNIQAAIQAASSTNPELAAPYRTLFNETNDVYKKMLDPKAVTEGLDDQLKNLQTRYKLAAMADPQVAAAVTVSNLLGNSPEVSLAVSGNVIKVMSKLSTMQFSMNSNGAFVPQVVGDPETEGPALSILKSAAGKLIDPKVKNKEGLKTELGNTNNQILKQVGEALDKGAQPAQLKGLAEYFASPDYAQVVNSGTIDKQAAGAAKKTFQSLYEPAIIKGVQDKMENLLYQSSTGPMDRGRTPIPVKDAMNIRFTGSGIVFEPKNDSKDPVERQSQKDAIRDLNSAQKGINQLIHIGAHMEGSTDYQAYWENNKHIFLPNVYSKYKGLEIGDVKNGMRYKGGDAKSEKSWEKVNGG